MALKIDTKLNNMIGFNFRMGEMEAAIGIEQLKKLKKILKTKQELSYNLTKKLKCLKIKIIRYELFLNISLIYLLAFSIV